MKKFYKIFQALRKLCMVLLPIGLVLAVITNLKHNNPDFAVSVLFLIILPILIILTKVPITDGSKLSLADSKIERTMVLFAKILGVLILIYVVLAFTID